MRHGPWDTERAIRRAIAYKELLGQALDALGEELGDLTDAETDELVAQARSASILTANEAGAA